MEISNHRNFIAPNSVVGSTITMLASLKTLFSIAQCHVYLFSIYIDQVEWKKFVNFPSNITVMYPYYYYLYYLHRATFNEPYFI